MIPMKNAASGAAYMTAAKIAKIVARSRRRLVTDNEMAERARTGPSTPSHNAESTLNQRSSVGLASVSHANRYPSENCQIKTPARMMMTMRRPPSVFLGQSLGNAIAHRAYSGQKLTHSRLGLQTKLQINCTSRRGPAHHRTRFVVKATDPVALSGPVLRNCYD